MAAYQFLQRTVRHQELLEGEAKKNLEREIPAALQKINIQKFRFVVHPSHVHIFFELPPHVSVVEFLISVKLTLAAAANVPWDEEHYLLPIAECTDDVVNAILADAHRPVRMKA